MLEIAAADLGELVADVAFLGGAAISLWISDPAAPPIRPTRDVDVIVEVGTTVEYYALGERLRAQGFQENPDARQLCAWKHRVSNLALDVMPTDVEILGFSNRWYAEALTAAVERELPSRAVIRAVTPPFLVATKIEAFRGRGNGDYLASRDFGDLIALIDGRAELIDEIAAAPLELRRYLADAFAVMRRDLFYESGVTGALPFDSASQARVPGVNQQIDQIIRLGT